MRKEQLKNILDKTSFSDQLWSDDPAVMRERVLATSELHPFIAEIRETAEGLLNVSNGGVLEERIPSLSYTTFRVFAETGSRHEYELVYFKRRQWLTTFGVMAWLEPDNEAYTAALNNIIWSVCDEYTWCLTSHLSGGSELDTDRVVGLHDDPLLAYDLTIDLFAAETGFTLVELLWLHGTSLPPLIRKRMRAEVMGRILRPFVTRQEPYFWERATHNWASVCAGSIGATALYMLEDSEELAAVWARVLPALQCYLSGFNDDGVCEEGYGYWQYGFGYYVYAADLLQSKTAGAVNLFTEEKVRQIALFQQKAFLGGRHVVNFSDSPVQAGVSLGFTHYLHELFAEVTIPANELQSSFHDDHCYRWAPVFRQLVWHDSAKKGQPWEASSYDMKDAQWLVSRHATSERHYAFAAKGGHNAEPHNHNDLGHFILYANGVSLLSDLGAGQYHAAYFGAGRYDILCNGSQGHSVPIINGCYQKEGAQHRAQSVVAEIGSQKGTNFDRDTFSLELSSAYDVPDLTRFERTLIWHKSDQPVLELIDCFHFTQRPDSLVERLITLVKPDLEDDVVSLVTADAALSIHFDKNIMKPEIVELEHIDHAGHPVIVYAIDFHVLTLKEDVELMLNFVFG